MCIYICACSSYLNKRFRFKAVISRSLPSFNSAHGGMRGGGDMRFSQKHLVLDETMVKNNQPKTILNTYYIPEAKV